MDTLHLPTGLRDLLHTAFYTAISSNAIDVKSENGPRSPEPSRLLEAVYFSRRFVPTYYVLMIVVVLVATCQHWLQRRRQSERVQNIKSAEESKSHTSSSSSSTLLGDDESIRRDDRGSDELKPLLESKHTSSSNATIVNRLRRRLRSFATYQPANIPAVTARANHLPSNGTTLILMLFFLVNVFYLFYGIRFSLAMVFAFAHRAGLCFVVNLPVLYFLGAKNTAPLNWLTGWSYEKLNIFHRRLGEWMIILGILHFLGMLLTWYSIIRPQGYSLYWFLSLPIIIFGYTALSSYVAIWATSIGYIRESAYEFFLVSHITLQVAALVLLFLHHPVGRPYVGAALLIWALDRIVARMFLSSKKFVATLEIAKDKETVLLYCDVPINRSSRTSIKSGWSAGQHVFVSVPGMRWHHAYQAHPFTIASPAPPADSDGLTWQLQLIIRCKDGFSKDLLKYAEFHQHAEVYLDGPYGDRCIEQAVRAAEKVCFIAGGSGIAVTYPLAWSWWASRKLITPTSSRTVYKHGKKHKPNLVIHPQPSDSRWSHLWIRQIREHGNWITSYPLDDSRQVIRDSCDYDECLDFITHTYETRNNTDVNRPDIATEIRTWLRQTNKEKSDGRKRICFVVSGPDGLVRDVRNTVAALTREGHLIDLHVEKFGW